MTFGRQGQSGADRDVPEGSAGTPRGAMSMTMATPNL